MTYQTVAFYSQIGVMIFFMSILAGVLVYVFNPRNRSRFDEAARVPLRNTDELTTGMGEGHG